MNTRCDVRCFGAMAPPLIRGLSAGWSKYYLRKFIVVCPAKARTSHTHKDREGRRPRCNSNPGLGRRTPCLVADGGSGKPVPG